MWQKKPSISREHSLKILFSWAVVPSYTPQRQPIFFTKLVSGGVVYRLTVHYSFTQSGGPIQNYFLSSVVREATSPETWLFPHLLLAHQVEGFFFVAWSWVLSFIPPPPIVQPCAEPCGSAAGFDFLTAEVIQIEKNSHFTYTLNLCQCLVPCFNAWELKNLPNCWNANNASWTIIIYEEHLYVLFLNKKNT
jgi:hypothetical protein